MTMLYTLQPEKVNKIVLCPGIKKLKELYDREGFCVSFLKELFSGVYFRRRKRFEEGERKQSYYINFRVSNNYLCNILRMTCKLNHFQGLQIPESLQSSEIVETWLREKRDDGRHFDFLDFDKLENYMKEYNFKNDDFIELCRWLEHQLMFSFEILRKCNESSISRKKKLASILDEL